MKSSTLNTLMVAKSILGETKYLANSGNKHSCTAGVILLQDFVELVVLAALDELDVDEQRALESKSFDELLGELKKQKVPIVKSGTIKALNKQRVISKHYGQLTEPASVVNYFNVALVFVDKILEHIFQKKLLEIFVTDVLQEGEPKELIEKCIVLSKEERYLDALKGLRKAFYNSYEHEYCIYSYRDKSESEGPLGLIGLLIREGKKAHYWTKNKEWIDKNVVKPTDFIQINHDQLKADCIEIGSSTVDIENFRRLTPGVVVKTEKDKWHFEYTTAYEANELNEDNFNYCLDVLIDFLLKKQEMENSRRYPKREKTIPAPPIYIGKPVYKSPSQNSATVGVVLEDYLYTVESVTTGFDSNETYLFVDLYPKDNQFAFDNHIRGYLLDQSN